MAYGIQTSPREPIAFAPISPRYTSERGDCSECQITLSDPLTDEVVRVGISLTMPEGMTFESRSAALKACDPNSAAWWTLSNTYPGSANDQGYFASIADGKRLIELARNTVEIPAIADMLAQAGFSLAHTLPNGAAFYRRFIGRHMFTIVVHANYVWLSFERDRANGCRNLLRLASAIEGVSGTIPCTWPSYLQNPAVHVLLACQMADDYEAAGRTAATRRSRKA